LLNALLHHAPHLAEVPRAGIVHRWTRTPRPAVVAKTIIAQTDLVRQLQARTVSREYLALVHGEVARAGRVDAPIDRHPSQRTKMAWWRRQTGDHALYNCRVFSGCTCCAASWKPAAPTRSACTCLHSPPAGGRPYLHQGRAEMSAANARHPRRFPRQALHAERLGWNIRKQASGWNGRWICRRHAATVERHKSDLTGAPTSPSALFQYAATGRRCSSIVAAMLKYSI